MTVSPEDNTPTKRPFTPFLRRWGLLLCLPPALVFFAWADGAQKRTNLPGFCPADAEFTVSAVDFGYAWEQIQSLEEYEGYQAEIATPFGWIEYYIHSATGIRPTAARWSLWMGEQLLAGKSSDGIGLCVHPGLLMRIASRLARLSGESTDNPDVFHWGAFYFAWREGFLIVSESRAYVEASLVSPMPEPATGVSRDEVCIGAYGARSAIVRVYARSGLPLDGWVDWPVQVRTTPLRSDALLPPNAVFQFQGSRIADAGYLLGPLERIAKRAPFYSDFQVVAAEAITRWNLTPLTSTWDTGVTEAGFSI